MLFRQAGYLHSISKYGGDRLEILQVTPSIDSLELVVSALIGNELDRFMAVLPLWYEGDTRLANGRAGVRYRVLPRREGVEFFILGQRCSVKVIGIDIDEFEQRCKSLSDPELRIATTEPFHFPAEVGSERPDDTDVIVSAIIRRVGVLLAMKPTSIDLWTPHRGRLSVEVITTDRSKEAFDQMISRLTSPDLFPQMTVIRTEGHTGYRTELRLTGHDAELDLRIQTL